MATNAPSLVIDGADPLSKIMAHYDKSELTEQTYAGCELLRKKVLKVLDKPGVQGQVQIRAGGFSSTGWIGDGDAKPDPVSVKPKVGQYDLAILLSTLQWGRAAYKHAVNSGNAETVVNIVERELKAAKEDMTSQLGVGIAAGTNSLGSPVSQLTADSGTTLTVTDASGFRIGNYYQVYDGSTLVDYFKVTAITITADPASNDTIEFESGGTGGNNTAQWDTTDTIHPRGAKVDGMVGFQDLTAAQSLYGVAQTTHNWAGNLVSVGGALTKEDIKQGRALQEKHHMKGITHWIGNGTMEMYLNELMVGQRRYGATATGREELLGGEIDIYGAPFIKDNWFKNGDLYGFDNEQVFLHQFQKVMAERDDATGEVSRRIVRSSPTHYAVEADISCHANIRCEKRSSVLRLSGITSPA